MSPEGWGFVDNSGALVINPQFERAEPFANNLAAVYAAPKEPADGEP